MMSYQSYSSYIRIDIVLLNSSTEVPPKAKLTALDEKGIEISEISVGGKVTLRCTAEGAYSYNFYQVRFEGK